jgi:molecular chaperone Hsp33
MEEQEVQDVQEGMEVRSYFVRGRNALLVRGDFSEFYLDYYLHQGQHGYQHQPGHDGRLKEALAALTLHIASRPWNESWAWTIHLGRQELNLFVTGDNRRGTVVGQLFTENVKADGRNLFLADLVRERGESRRSAVEFEGDESFEIVEEFYARSEQRPARFFRYSEEDYVLISAQPDCDLEWLQGLTEEAVRVLDQTETLSLLEQRRYRWECGCSQARMLTFLAPMMRADPEGLFQGEDSLRIGCPRCGARHVVTRETLEAVLDQDASGSEPGGRP